VSVGGELGIPVNAIYRATEGEGILVGSSQVFVRLQGCAVGCINCDSRDTWEFGTSESLSLEDIISEVERVGHGIKRLSITGGDPLHPKLLPGTLEIARAFKRKGYFVNVEAAGTRVVDELFDMIDFISFDVKTPSTGVKTSIELVEKMARHYSGKFQIKAVVEHKLDFDYCLKMQTELVSRLSQMSFAWVLTPAYNPNENFPMERFKAVIDWNEEVGGPFRVIGQQHKWIHGPDKKRV
jgi:7-carboxy-7-deazaguanine synthase